MIDIPKLIVSQGRVMRIPHRGAYQRTAAAAPAAWMAMLERPIAFPTIRAPRPATSGSRSSPGCAAMPFEEKQRKTATWRYRRPSCQVAHVVASLIGRSSIRRKRH